MNSDLVTTSFDGASVQGAEVATLTLNNPQRRNALSLEMIRALDQSLVAAAGRQSTRVIVIRGAGPAFSAGHDLAEMQRERSEQFYAELFGACTDVMERLHRLPTPVIAQVHGVATAAGCQLVAACDLAVCSVDARFATPGVNIGLFCSTPMVPISRAVGRKRALQMLLTGEMIRAAQAVEWGLVNQAVPHADLDAAVRELARKITIASPQVVGLGKLAFWNQIDETETVAYTTSGEVMRHNAMLDDAREGISAFLEKRAPAWPTP